MSWSNFHSHSTYSDGADVIAASVAAAVEAGAYAWGCADHAPLPFACGWAMPEERLPEYIHEIRTLKLAYADQIQIYAGLEVDYLPGITGPGRFRRPQHGLDYLVGSVHFVDQLPDGRHWEIDGPHQVFLEGLQLIFGGEARAAVTRYYGLIRQMVQEDAPDIVGHLDKIIIQNEAGQLWTGEEPWYRQAVLETLEDIRDHDLIVEVNTRGVYKGLVKNGYPAGWILRQMHAMGIRMTLSSDSHHPREIFGAFPEVAQFLRELGIGHLDMCWEGEWQPVPFDRWGLRVPGHSPVML